MGGHNGQAMSSIDISPPVTHLRRVTSQEKAPRARRLNPQCRFEVIIVPSADRQELENPFPKHYQTLSSEYV